MKKIILATSVALTTTLANAILGPIPVYLNTEYRTDNPIIDSIASTLSFSADDIKATGANTFLDFLATIPSVGLVDAQGNVPAVFMRGGNSEHTLFLIDGVEVHDYSTANGSAGHNLSIIPLNDIEKIEVIKGSGSILYGSSAIAGVIAITTKKSANGESATINTKFGTHNSKTYTLSASSGNEDGFIRFTHNTYTTDGINVRTADTSNEKDGISNHSTQIKFGNKNFNINYLESRNKTEYDQCFTVNNCLLNRGLSKISINVNKQISNTWRAKLFLAQTKSKRNSGKNATTIGDKFKSSTITMLNDIKVDGDSLNIGLSQTEDKNTTDNQKLSSKDVFINWQKSINSIDINTGIRHIRHGKFGGKNIYNLSVAKYLNNSTKLTGVYGTAYRAPTLIETLGQSGTTYYLPSPGLKPETSKNIELGIEKQHNWGVIGTKIYKNKIKNHINYRDNRFFNEDKFETKGVELSLNVDIASYNVNFSHNYNKSKKNNATTANVRRPKNITNLTVNKQYGKFNSRLQVIKKSSSLDANTKLNGYTLVNLSTNYKYNDKTKLSLNINNATNKNYTIIKGYNQPGIEVEASLDYKF